MKNDNLPSPNRSDGLREEIADRIDRIIDMETCGAWLSRDVRLFKSRVIPAILALLSSTGSGKGNDAPSQTVFHEGLSTGAEEPRPVGYRYLYPTYPPEGATVWQFETGGREINGSKPIRSEPVYAAPPPQPQRDGQWREFAQAVINASNGKLFDDVETDDCDALDYLAERANTLLLAPPPAGQSLEEGEGNDSESGLGPDYDETGGPF